MSTLRTTTSSNLATLASTANTGDTYYETNNNRIVTWNGTTWTYYDNDGSIAPFANSYSVTLDGVDDQITGPSDCLGFTGTSWTWCFWARWGTLSTTFFVPFGASDPTGTTAFRASSTYIRIYTYGANTTYQPTGGIQTDKWYFIAAVQDGTAHSHYVKSSTDDNVNTATGTSTRAAGAVTMIGGGTSYYDEFATFNSALSSSELDAIYNSGSPADVSSYSSLASWWRMGDSDSGTGTSVSNEVSGGDSLSLTNGATFSTTIPS